MQKAIVQSTYKQAEMVQSSPTGVSSFPAYKLEWRAETHFPPPRGGLTGKAIQLCYMGHRARKTLYMYRVQQLSSSKILLPPSQSHRVASSLVSTLAPDVKKERHSYNEALFPTTVALIEYSRTEPRLRNNTLSR